MIKLLSKNVLILALLCTSIATDALAWLSLWRVEADNHQLAIFLITHTVSSILSLVAITLLLPPELKTPFYPAISVIFALMFFIPLAGCLGFCIGPLTALLLPRTEEIAWQRVTHEPPLPFSPAEVSLQPVYSRAGLLEIIRHAGLPDKRLNAVMATQQMPLRKAVPILRVALKDPEDDVRLLAYSMLDSKENTINENIKKLQDSLAELDPESDQYAKIHQLIAQEYWELIYLGLAQGDVREHMLNSASQHLKTAMENTKTASGHFLAGRIALERGDADTAIQELLASQILGLDQTEISPYLAECMYKKRELAKLKALAIQIKKQNIEVGMLSRAINFWEAA